MTTTQAPVAGWFSGRLPDDWTREGAPEVTVDRDEITVVLRLPAPDLREDADDEVRAETIAGRVAAFRDDTRERRIAIANEAEHRFDRKVAWGVEIDGRRALFTHLAVPTMTRLRQPERIVLDTLIAGGVARSRADAVAWCVRLVGRHTDDWLADLRRTLADVERVRAEGPDCD
jgi:hypothetical protein